MRIAQICPYDIDRPGGVQTHILDTAAALEELGHEVVIVAPRMRLQDGPAQSSRIMRFGRARKIGLGGTAYEISIALGRERQRLAALMRDSNFDVVHYHTMWTPFLPLQAFLFSGAPAVATFHDTTANTFSGRMLRALFRLLSLVVLPRLDAVITPSDAPKAHLVTRGMAINVLPPCVDLSRFAGSIRAKQRFNDGRINILFLGRLEQRKGAALLLQAYAGLAAEGLPLRLLIAGSGEEEPHLRSFVKDHSIPNVEFLGGFAKDEAPQLYAECDIFCAPSPYGESFGIVIAEAMASGKPVVAAANAGYRTVLTGEASTFLTSPGSVEALAHALRALALDAELRKRLGEWGRVEAMRYDCRQVAPRFVALYEQAIRKKSMSRKPI